MFPPALIMILGGLLLPVIPKSERSVVVLFLPVITLIAVWMIPDDAGLIIRFAGFHMNPVFVHEYTKIFSTIFCIAAFLGAIYSSHRITGGKENVMELSSAMVYSGCAVGATFCGDFISFFIYWEVMAVASTIVVLCGGTAAARRSALRYAYIHFLGGVLLLAGITAYFSATGSIVIRPMDLDLFDISSTEKLATLLIFVGIIINAGAPPFSSWIADSYPESSPAGGVFLSAFTTKTAVFALLIMFPGNRELIYLGLFMVFYGIIMGSLANDLRRMLSYSIVNQVGFMLAGIGIGTKMALYGTAAHAFCHILYKCLLFMSAGAVINSTGTSKTTKLGGLYKSMKITMICAIVGALSISAFPLTSGYISKALYIEGITETGNMLVWMLFLAGAVGVFALTGCKYIWFVFFQKEAPAKSKIKEAPVNMRVAMILCSILCIAPGIFPQAVYFMLPEQINFQPNTISHLVSQLQLLLFGGFAFFLLLHTQKRTDTIILDFDWFIRKPLKELVQKWEEQLADLGFGIPAIKRKARNVEKVIEHNFGPDGVFANSWRLGNVVLLVASLLGVYLLLYYIDYIGK